jgi:predicted RNA-binding Zn-ribbon protein involved in translation (DUF1610 family)
MEDKMDEIYCPHCNEEITGMDRILFEATLENKSLLDWHSSCPNCGETIKKEEWDKAQEKKKAEK